MLWEYSNKHIKIEYAQEDFRKEVMFELNFRGQLGTLQKRWQKEAKVLRYERAWKQTDTKHMLGLPCSRIIRGQKWGNIDKHTETWRLWPMRREYRIGIKELPRAFVRFVCVCVCVCMCVCVCVCTIFKVFIEFVTILLLFYVFLVTRHLGS